tara:strand:+ start:39 stop:275 length:237 start_codon:yes stop_codon:yes gene_type:complete
MTEPNTIDQANPDAEVVDVVSAIADNQRAKAIDAIQDMLYAKSSDAIGNYKKTVAKTYFDEPVEKPEEPSNETDNGND